MEISKWTQILETPVTWDKYSLKAEMRNSVIICSNQIDAWSLCKYLDATNLHATGNNRVGSWSACVHRGEPINERADTLAEEGRTISDDDKRWDDRTDRMTFEVQKGDTTVRSVWTNSVRNAFRKQAGWAKLQKVRATAATHWTARVWYRHNQRWLQASKEGAEASKSGSFKDERAWGRKCFEDLD
jgi:hypothetical protein